MTHKTTANSNAVQQHCVDAFYKSSFSGASNCVEIAKSRDGAVKVRDSKAADGAVLNFTRAEWRAFVSGVRNGEFDV